MSDKRPLIRITLEAPTEALATWATGVLGVAADAAEYPNGLADHHPPARFEILYVVNPKCRTSEPVMSKEECAKNLSASRDLANGKPGPWGGA